MDYVQVVRDSLAKLCGSNSIAHFERRHVAEAYMNGQSAAQCATIVARKRLASKHALPSARIDQISLHVVVKALFF